MESIDDRKRLFSFHLNGKYIDDKKVSHSFKSVRKNASKKTVQKRLKSLKREEVIEKREEEIHALVCCMCCLELIWCVLVCGGVVLC
jgi:hypothetical protein